MQTVIIRVGENSQTKIVVSKPKKQSFFARFFRKQTPRITISEQEVGQDADIHLQSIPGE